MGCSSGGVSWANSIKGGVWEKIVDAGRDTRRSAMEGPDGEASRGEGVSGVGVSDLGGDLFNVVDAEAVRWCCSGLSLREEPPKAEMNDSTVR